MKLKRRDLLTTFGLGTYALAVRADAADQIAPAQLSGLREEFDRIAPAVARHDFGAEPNMTSVGLETDLLVAGGAWPVSARQSPRRARAPKSSLCRIAPVWAATPPAK